MAKAKSTKAVSPELADEATSPPRNPASSLLFSRFTLVGLTSLLLCAVIYWLRFNTVFGHPYVDDAYYLLLGKALANGQPYALINTPVTGIMPIYPPVYPWLLSLLFRVAPQFPQNLWLFKLVPVVSMILLGPICFYYFRRVRNVPQWAAYLLAFFTIANPSLIFFATSTLMSECFYMLLQTCALLAAGLGAEHWHAQEKSNEPSTKQAGKQAGGLRWAVLTGVLMSAAFMTRSIGVTLVAAILGAWLLRRWWKPLLVAGAIVAVTAGPWQLYARAHAPSETDKQAQQGYITQSYLVQFWQRAAGEADMGNITPGEIPARIGHNIAQIAGEKFGLLIASRVLLIAGPSALGFLSVILFLLALIGWIACLREGIGEAELYIAASITLIILWPWEPTRFLLPLTPWLLFYVIRGGQVLLGLRKRSATSTQSLPAWSIATVFMALLIALNLLSNFDFIGSLDAQGRRKAGELGEFTEIEEMMKWVNQNVAENELCASLNPGLVYLYTNRKTVSAQDPLGNWEQWKAWGVRYLVLTTRYGVPPQDSAGKPIRVAWQSKRVPMLRVIDLGTPNERAPWPASMK